MDDNDPGDLDGDGEFDAIDITIIENGEKDKQSLLPNPSGCCFVLMVIGASLSAGWWIAGIF